MVIFIIFLVSCLLRSIELLPRRSQHYMGSTMTFAALAPSAQCGTMAVSAVSHPETSLFSQESSVVTEIHKLTLKTGGGEE